MSHFLRMFTTAVAFACFGFEPVATSANPPTAEEAVKDPARFLDAVRKELKWDEPAEPAHIAGPIYFVGTQGLSVFLITTPEGHIVLNTGMPGSGPLIAASIKKLGFDPKDVKLLLVGHAHCDHVGGHAYLHELSGAKIVALAEEQELMESGGKTDFHYGHVPEFGFDAAPVEQVIHDGEVIELGGLTLTALLTNGHTRGSATYVMDFVEDGRTYSVVFPNGTSVNPGYRLINDPSYPGIKEDFANTFSTLATLRPDIWLMPHNEANGLFERLERAKTEGLQAWLDRPGYKTWVAEARAKFEAAVATESASAAPVPVTVENFVRAESDLYFGGVVKDGGFGKFTHNREVTPIDKQTVIRMNRDTLYSGAVFDLDAGPVTVFLPDAGKRFLSLQTINEDHYAYDVVYEPGRYSFSREKYGTRYLMLAVRILVNLSVSGDLEKVHALQDAIRVEQAATGSFEVPHWDPASQKKIRDALIVLGATIPDSNRMFGRPDEVDPIRHLIGSAIAWGGNPETAAKYLNVTPSENDGKTPYALTVKDVPVDGFWSISVYNAHGYFERNDRNAYTLNNLTAKPNADGSVTVRFGDCGTNAENCLPIVEGWNYIVRMYRPRKAVLDGTFKFPAAQPVK